MAARSDTRSRMIEGATSLMRKRGFTATSLRDVWELTDTPRGSVYFHFPGGKEELGHEVIQAALATLLVWTEEAQREAGSAEEFLRLLTGKLADFLEASGYEQGCPIGAIAIEAPPEFPALRAAASAAFQTWSRRIAEGLVAFGVAIGRSNDIAKAAAPALEGAILVSKSAQNTNALDLTANLLSHALA